MGARLTATRGGTGEEDNGEGMVMDIGEQGFVPKYREKKGRPEGAAPADI